MPTGKILYLKSVLARLSTGPERAIMLSRVAAEPLLLWDFMRRLGGRSRPSPRAQREELRRWRSTVMALAQLTPSARSPVPSLDASMVGASDPGDLRALADLLDAYGSDKRTKHGYDLLYAMVLGGRRNEPLNIVEIGIGTNNVRLPSNMGRTGRPGASLRAFRDWAPRALVHGADVDRDILFVDDRISTSHVDQLDVGSLEAFAARFPPQTVDLFIDDGLHTAEANLNTLVIAMRLVKRSGAIVVEDILEAYLDVWRVVQAVLEPEWSVRLFKDKTEYCCVIMPRASAAEGS
jgi:hypothetical protein